MEFYVLLLSNEEVWLVLSVIGYSLFAASELFKVKIGNNFVKIHASDLA